MNKNMIVEEELTRKQASVFLVIMRSVCVIFRAAPAWILSYVLISLLYGLSFGFITVLKQELFDCIAQYVVIEKSIVTAVIPLILFSGAVLANFISSIYGRCE